MYRAQKNAMNCRCAHAETDAMGADSSVQMPSIVGTKYSPGLPAIISDKADSMSPGNSRLADSGVQEVTSNAAYNTASGMRQRAFVRRDFVSWPRGKKAICNKMRGSQWCKFMHNRRLPIAGQQAHYVRLRS